MVMSATSLSYSGVRDWIIQRVTAIILAIYLMSIAGFILFHPGLTYQSWTLWLKHPFMQVFTFIALLSLVGHAWVGVWTIFTDYIKPTGLRLMLEVMMVLALISYLVWGVIIIW